MNPVPTLSVSVNGETRQWPAGSTIADVVAALQLTGKRIAVERNQEIVPRAQHGSTQLQAGDQVEIVQAIGGG